jgi:hypothetical protein
MAATLRANRLFIGILALAIVLGLLVALWPAWDRWYGFHTMYRQVASDQFCAPSGACYPGEVVNRRVGWQTLPGALAEDGKWWDGAVAAVVVFVVLTGLVLSSRALREHSPG